MTNARDFEIMTAFSSTARVDMVLGREKGGDAYALSR